MLCIEKEDSRGKPEAVANSIDASEEESDAANTGACGKVKRQHMDHIAEKGNVGSFHCGLVHQPVSIHEALKMKPKPPWMNDGMKNKSSVGCQEIETKVRSHPSDEEGWENSSLREFDGPLSLEERRTCKTPPEIQGASCAPGGERQRLKKETEQYSQSLVLQRLRWQRQSSWTPSQSFLVWLEKQVTQGQRTLKSK